MKRAWAMIITVIIVLNLVAITVFATGSPYPLKFAIDSSSTIVPPPHLVVNSDNDRRGDRFTVDEAQTPTYITTRDTCGFNSTYYFVIDSPETKTYLSDTKYFKTSITNKKNNNMLDGNPTVTSRVIDGTRYDVIRVKIKDNSSTEEEEIDFTMKMRATSKIPSGATWSEDDEYQVRFRLFVSNDIDDSGDADVDAGDSVVFKPNKNDDNTVTWGASDYPLASLEFEASSDADKFYAKLSTKANGIIYADYGEPADAELFFRNFSGDSIDATSRGTLTLYNPWADDRYNYSPDPRNIWIYRINGNQLEDFTSKFEYVNEDNTPEGIEGWRTRTRVLDAYVISDKELLLNNDDWEDLPPPDELPDVLPDVPSDRPSDDGNQGGTGDRIPSTGSHDFVLVALIAGMGALLVAYVAHKRKE